jgi:hypothetical protein
LHNEDYVKFTLAITTINSAQVSSGCPDTTEIFAAADLVSGFYEANPPGTLPVVTVDEDVFNAISTFPNPATDRLFLNIPGTVQIARVIIFNSGGELLYTQEGPDIESIDLSTLELSTGFYFYQVEALNGELFTGQFMFVE